MNCERSFWAMIELVSISSSFNKVFFFPTRWKSKKLLEQVSPYLSQFEEERCRFLSTDSWNTSASLHCES